MHVAHPIWSKWVVCDLLQSAAFMAAASRTQFIFIFLCPKFHWKGSAWNSSSTQNLFSYCYSKPTTTKLLPDYWQSVVELLSYIFKRYVEAKLKHCCHTRHSVLFLSIKSDKEFLVFCLYPRLNTRFDECTQFLVSILKLALGLPRRFVNSMIFFKNSGNL